MDVTIYQRDDGSVSEVLEIRGRWLDGRLTLTVDQLDARGVHTELGRIITNR